MVFFDLAQIYFLSHTSNLRAAQEARLAPHYKWPEAHAYTQPF